MTADYEPFDAADQRERSRKTNGAHGHAPIADLPLAQVSTWHERAIPPRQWLVRDRIPMHNVTLLSGDGAVGKSIVMAQLMAATALNRDWLGVVPDQGPVLAINAEEDEDEFHRRLLPIVAHYGASLADLDQLYALCLAGRDAIMAEPDRDGIIRPTELFARVKSIAVEIRPRLVVLDNAADVFGGKENDRSQVRQFVTLLRGLAIDAGSSVLLSSHPSLTGLATGTGLSGSTAWHNSARARMVMSSTAKTDDDPSDDDLRTLEMKKSNYGPATEKITLKWSNGLFLPAGTGTVDWLTRHANETRIDDLFLAILTRFSVNGQHVSHKPGPTYAPTAFAGHGSAEGVKSDAFAKSMQRLLDAGRVKIEVSGPPSKQRSRLIIARAE